MSFLETIRLNEGNFNNLQYHFNRMNDTLLHHYGTSHQWNIETLLNGRSFPMTGLYKCRIVYDTDMREISFVSYTAKKIKGLKIVEDDEINYSYKFLDRSVFDKHLSSIPADEDILIVKKGLITDTSYSNVVFQTNNNEWLTPAEPLLKGTMRQFLLDTGRIREEYIEMGDLSHFNVVRLINSMLLDQAITIDVGKIS